MSAGTERPNGVAHNAPSTPPEAMVTLSQQSMPSTEGPPSPLDPASSFKTELNDDRVASPLIIPSSLTPPPSSQVPQLNGAAGHPLGYVSSQRASMFSPPATTAAHLRREGPALAADYAAPTGEQIMDAPAEDLRRMLHASLAENARLKMETAHHKLQYSLLSMQADEEAKRAAVEHDMTRREVEVLRMAENARQARRDLSVAAENTQVKYIQLKAAYDLVISEIETHKKREKNFKKVLQQKEDEIISLTDDRDLLLRRIRENREHFHMLCSPGGAFYGALTPKQPAVATPQQHRATPRQTPRSHRQDDDHSQIGFQVLLEALSHDNNSAPSTPLSAHRPAPRMLPKHTRGAQSMSSLPTTPMTKPRGELAALLPSIDLIPRTEPPPRFTTNRFVPHTEPSRGRKSRESTISADDNEELARAALNMAAVNRSMISNTSQRSAPRSQRQGEEGEEVYESQASQAASEMLRRDPRQSFDEVASSVGSRDGTPAPAEKSAKLQAKLFAPVNKAGLAVEKRKYGGHAEYADGRREAFTSPAKRVRLGPSSTEAQRVGLGIQYSQ
ncbi:hypothetical protein SCUP515_02521 [Seiridium cupressi]